MTDRERKQTIHLYMELSNKRGRSLYSGRCKWLVNLALRLDKELTEAKAEIERLKKLMDGKTFVCEPPRVKLPDPLT